MKKSSKPGTSNRMITGSDNRMIASDPMSGDRTANPADAKEAAKRKQKREPKS